MVAQPPKDYPQEPAKPKRSFFERNPKLYKPALALLGLFILVVLSLVFGEDRVWTMFSGLVEKATAMLDVFGAAKE